LTFFKKRFKIYKNMRKINFSQITADLIKDFSKKEKEIIIRRFGLNGGEKETLQAIGDSFNLTRERIRQLEERAIKKIITKIAKYKEFFNDFKKYFEENGGAKKADEAEKALGGKHANKVCFLLTMNSEDFKKVEETDNFYSFWCLNNDTAEKVKKNLNKIFQTFTISSKPLSFDSLNKKLGLSKTFLVSLLEISKLIGKNEEKLYGLLEWPEIKPKNTGDRIINILRKFQKPLHFTQLAKEISTVKIETIHNELIRNSNFVMVGRGTYALKEWGYKDGETKDIIIDILKEEGAPLSMEEIKKRISLQRIVKPSTIMCNLYNKKFFTKTPDNKYWINEA